MHIRKEKFFMFVSIILDTDYYGMGGRDKWYLKNLSHAKENNCIVITHEHLKKHYKKYRNACAERFYKEFEMRQLSDAEYEEISKGFVEDSVFEELESEFVSRSEMLMYLFQNRYTTLENALIKIIDSERKKKQDEKVEAIFNCIDCFASISYLGEYYDCPVIPYSFSAIRKMHGYRQTLYWAGLEGTIRSSSEAKRRYKAYIEGTQIPLVFSRRELLAIFGKEKNLPLLRLLNAEPEHEIGICKTPNSIYPYDYIRFKYTDTDLYYEVNNVLRTKDIIIRDHPNIPWNGTDQGTRKEHQRNDPISFILSCKRVTSVDSQILLKALLWNRTVIVKGEECSFAFLCEKDFQSEEKADIKALNYYIFAYLIPAELMFDRGYWQWRLNEKPSEYDIYMKHLDYYIEYFGYNKNILFNLNEKQRFTYLLKSRNCNEILIEELLRDETPKDINYDVMYSKLSLNVSLKQQQEFYCINQYRNGRVFSLFQVECEESTESMFFFPFVDVGGFANIVKVSVDDQDNEFDCRMEYYSKSDGKKAISGIQIPVGRHTLSVEWEYQFI